MPLYNVKRHAALFLRIECAECSFLLHGKRTLSWTSICNYHEYHIGENVGDVCRNVDVCRCVLKLTLEILTWKSPCSNVENR